MQPRKMLPKMCWTTCEPTAQWEKGGNFKKLKMSKITRYNVYGL